jgi:hypothetical protein
LVEAVEVRTSILKVRKNEMSKFSFSEHSKKVASHHAALAKSFTGLANHFTKRGHEDAAEHCESMAECHKALAACHEAAGVAAEKALADHMNKIVPDAPEAARNRLINRAGGPPLPRERESEFGKVSTEDLDPELADLVNPEA